MFRFPTAFRIKRNFQSLPINGEASSWGWFLRMSSKMPMLPKTQAWRGLRRRAFAHGACCLSAPPAWQPPRWRARRVAVRF